ncbi:MAG: ATP synthase F1 subunit gamma [Chloroflexi bacterium]|nr:ATP synthase F1 subunit gamma [Chloroflexota bacterium]
MATLRQIKRRIRSVTNTAKITKAMEMVAASKMRQAQQKVLATRPYADKMREVLAELAVRVPQGEQVHPLLAHRPTERVTVIHVTADRGLSGGLTANVNRRTSAFILDQEHPTSLITVGRKGTEFFSRYGRQITASFSGLGDRPSLLDTLAISKVAIDEYMSGAADRVYIIYPYFVTTVTQRPVVRRLLPIEPPAQVESTAEYIFEPDPTTVLGALLPRYVEMQVYHAVLEAVASEQSARMVAMRNATDNANELIRDLTLAYNKARQESITKELLDLVGGAAGLQ